VNIDSSISSLLRDDQYPYTQQNITGSWRGSAMLQAAHFPFSKDSASIMKSAGQNGDKLHGRHPCYRKPRGKLGAGSRI
jgi:hypothetical protein